MSHYTRHIEQGHKWQFISEETQRANKYTKKVIREMQIKTKPSFAPTRVAQIRELGGAKCWGGSGEREPSVPCWWEGRRVQYSGE